MEREKRLCNERATIPSITKMFAALFIPYFIYFNCMRIKMKNTYVIRLKLIILIGWKPRKSLIINIQTKRREITISHMEFWVSK